jgi:uncharacterized protein YndB with AHSA1/START domain
MTVSRNTVEGRAALRLERRLAHSVERVWRAVSEPAELQQWFVAAVAWIPEEGEEFEAMGVTGGITEVSPPRRLAWFWGVESYSFDLAPDGDGCRLVFTHVFNPEMGPDYQHAAGWDTYFDRLEAHLGGGHLSEEDAHAGVREKLDAYREAFQEA